MEVIHVNTIAEYKKEILDSKVPVIIDFWATWCMPCKMFGPVFEKASAEYKGKVKFIKIDVDEAQDVAMKFNIMSIPTVVLFNKGKEVQRQSGALNASQLKEFIHSNVEIKAANDDHFEQKKRA